MTKFFLHVGLHKTGTKFFQHMVFNKWAENNEDFIFNPPRLTQLICDLMKSDDFDLKLVLLAIKKEKLGLNRIYPNKKILISREIMSGNLFSFYGDFKLTHEKICKAFPEARIIIYSRDVREWLISCYRESIHEHHYQSFKKFIGAEIRDNKFAGGDLKKINFDNIVNTYKTSHNQVFVSSFELFKSSKELEVKKVADFVGIKKWDYVTTKVIPNRGYSTLSINISLLRYKIFGNTILEKWFIHRPIYFLGKNSIPAGFEHLSILPKDKYWHNGFFRDNEEVRSNNWPNITIIEKVKLWFSWRYFVKKILDRIVYLDNKNVFYKSLK